MPFPDEATATAAAAVEGVIPTYLIWSAPFTATSRFNYKEDLLPTHFNGVGLCEKCEDTQDAMWRLSIGFTLLYTDRWAGLRE